mgnify:CR=1 FL=1
MIFFIAVYNLNICLKLQLQVKLLLLKRNAMYYG